MGIIVFYLYTLHINLFWVIYLIEKGRRAVIAWDYSPVALFYLDLLPVCCFFVTDFAQSEILRFVCRVSWQARQTLTLSQPHNLCTSCLYVLWHHLYAMSLIILQRKKTVSNVFSIFSPLSLFEQFLVFEKLVKDDSGCWRVNGTECNRWEDCLYTRLINAATIFAFILASRKTRRLGWIITACVLSIFGSNRYYLNFCVTANLTVASLTTLPSMTLLNIFL